MEYTMKKINMYRHVNYPQIDNLYINLTNYNFVNILIEKYLNFKDYSKLLLVSKNLIPPEFICRNPDLFDWSLVSPKIYPLWLYSKNKFRVNWSKFFSIKRTVDDIICIFPHYIDSGGCIDCIKNDIFKQYYYSHEQFISVFYKIIDWYWYENKNIISTNIIKNYWNYIPDNTDYKWQIDIDFIASKNINWQECIKRKTFFVNDIIALNNKIDWYILTKNIKLSSNYVSKLYKYIRMNDCISNVCKYQELKQSFIIKHHKTLDMKNVSKYQKLKYETVIAISDYIHYNLLCENKHINKDDNVRIFNCGCIYVLPPESNIAIMKKDDKFNIKSTSVKTNWST